MEMFKSSRRMFEEWAEKRAKAIWINLHTNHLWERMLKNTLAITIIVTLALIPAVVEVFGKVTYLGAMTAVFGYPGRRFGVLVEALVLVISGTLIGVGWSLFGLYLSSLIYETNAPAAYTVRGIFLALALFFHGFLRSHTPRLFIFVLLFIIVSVVTLTSTATTVTKASATQLLYPILAAVAVLILVNILVFPEFSSRYLGSTTIETLGETVDTLRDAGRYFVSIVGESEMADDKIKPAQEHMATDDALATTEKSKEELASNAKISFVQRFRSIFQKSNEAIPDNPKAPKKVTLKSLTDRKARLREKLAGCKAAQQECNFELAFSVLPPGDLKPISITAMNKMVANAIALIGACESKYALMGDENDKHKPHTKECNGLEAIAINANVTGGDTSANTSSDKKSRKSPRKHKGNGHKRVLSKKIKTKLDTDLENLELVKPKKEIEFGDIELLRSLVIRITKPLADLQEKIDRSVEVVASSLAYCYDVPKLPSGARAPAGIELQEIDIRVDILTTALDDFDRASAIALEGAAAVHDLEHHQMDIMPRMETFLISLFLLNSRQCALRTLDMLRHSRLIVEKRQAHHDRRRLYVPKINWRKWLVSGGEEDSHALPQNARQNVRKGNLKDEASDDDSSTTAKELFSTKKDLESNPDRKPIPKLLKPNGRKKTNALKCKRSIQNKDTLVYRLRNSLADFIEYVAGSDDVLYSLKLVLAVFLVTWPALITNWNAWYSLNRGLWAALQLVLITEVAIGTSVMAFAIRTVGTTVGCVWGYVAYEAGNGNRVICVVILALGIITSAYVQLGSKYVKAGMVSTVSMCIVALATEDRTVPGTATENFLKRFVAFLIGGVVALIVQLVLFPVKARDRLVESLASSIHQIIQMEACLAYGIEAEKNLDHSYLVSERFEHARGKAQGALTAAATFLPFCANEPRLKGSFEGLALIYAEILYVLHAIVDRMDNMIHLRQEYGSGVLEELNAQVFVYRRNVAASITIILFAVHEGLTTKLPLPQFLPSARLSHLRMINRVREVVLEKGAGDLQNPHDASCSGIETSMVKLVIRQKFLSWNAASAGQIEVIEFLEELVDLTKLLVGANEFRSGMLTRPTYREYMGSIDRGAEEIGEREENPQSQIKNPDQDGNNEDADMLADKLTQPKKPSLRKRNTFLGKDESGEMKPSAKDHKSENQKNTKDEELPRSLQRVRSRRIEEMSLQRTRSHGERAGK